MTRLRYAILVLFLSYSLYINIVRYFSLTNYLGNAGCIGQTLDHLFYLDAYRFFSTNIAKGLVLTVERVKGGERHPVPLRFSTSEMRNKCLSLFFDFYRHAEIRDAVAHSLAVHIMESENITDTLVVCFYTYKLPTPQAYEHGHSPTLSKLYQTEVFIQP